MASMIDSTIEDGAKVLIVSFDQFAYYQFPLREMDGPEARKSAIDSLTKIQPNHYTCISGSSVNT